MPMNKTERSNEEIAGISKRLRDLKDSIENEIYSMKFEEKGKCYIFSQRTFVERTGLRRRKYADDEADMLRGCFKDLGFHVCLFEDLKVREIEMKLQEISEEDFSEYGCFVCCVLTYGDDGNLYGCDRKYRTEKIFSPFGSHICPTLAGKPKIFIIEAYQNENTGFKPISSDSFVPGNNPNFKTPTNTDFLICHATIPVSYSRSSSEKSKFIEILCNELRRHAKKKDLLKLLTTLNYKLSFTYESFGSLDSSSSTDKPLLWITSTLTKEIKFSSKG